MESLRVKECYQKSINLLLNNTTKFGFLASLPSEKALKRNYLSVFGRDASICSLGALVSGNTKLINTAKASLLTLAKYQAPNGQIPNYVKLSPKLIIDFWKFGCIDATLWWLIALKVYDKQIPDHILFKKLKKNIDKAIRWLNCQEHQEDFLLMQNEASDWADIMPRSGKVLYSNALWVKVKELYKLPNKTKTKENFNKLFYPFSVDLKNIPRCDQKNIEKIKKEIRPTDFYLSYVNGLVAQIATK